MVTTTEPALTVGGSPSCVRRPASPAASAHLWDKRVYAPHRSRPETAQTAGRMTTSPTNYQRTTPAEDAASSSDGARRRLSSSQAGCCSGRPNRRGGCECGCDGTGPRRHVCRRRPRCRARHRSSVRGAGVSPVPGATLGLHPSVAADHRDRPTTVPLRGRGLAARREGGPSCLQGCRDRRRGVGSTSMFRSALGFPYRGRG